MQRGRTLAVALSPVRRCHKMRQAERAVISDGLYFGCCWQIPGGCLYLMRSLPTKLHELYTPETLIKPGDYWINEGVARK